ncbi:MAG: AAA family ATPase [Bacteroidales bacterium]|jgi:predicted AAA+ superfamily ATPase|nr:AAA family ATPase [Bacteroidales bacterium]
MQIHRRLIEKLVKWKQSRLRNPLILQGARQVGKTYLLKSFGDAYYESTAYFNFEKSPELAQFFEHSKDPMRILESLSVLHGRKINPESTLIVFDEIQECNNALNSLKYFAEEAPEYHIACAGSLLGVALSKGSSFPVGKVDFQTLYPISFREFLNYSDKQLYSYLNDLDSFSAIPDLFFNKLLEKFKLYTISGGMPNSIIALRSGNGVEMCEDVLRNIIMAYRLDFSKHVDNNDIQKISYIWDSIPSQLSKENKKFVYRVVKSGARAREYEDALSWLVNAGLIYKIYRNEKANLPLKAYDDLSAFKIYTHDVGILRRLSDLKPSVLADGNRIFTEFKGALSENFVLQSLINQFDEIPRYWSSGNLAEIDFLIQFENDIIPIEVKSNTNVKSKSLFYYRKKYDPPLSIRYSLNNLQYANGILNLPLFMADFTKQFLAII